MKGWRLAIALSGLCLVAPALVLADAVPCTSLGIDPTTEGDGILERYFVATDGIGGLGCWIHPHPNGKDAVFTPFSWGRVPNPGKQGLIDETMEAIDDTSAFLGALGTVDTQLYVLLTDLERDWQAEAHTIEDERCWMEVTPNAGWAAWGPTLRREFKSTIAHEIAHCFFSENFEDYNEQGTNFDTWWDESGAEFLMAQVYPTVNSEYWSAIEFDLDGREFPQPYNAAVLLQHYSNTNDVPATLEFLRTAWANGRSRAAYSAYLNSSGLDAFYHDFNVRQYAGTVLDPGGGNMPTEAVIDSLATQRLQNESGSIAISRIEPRRLVLVDLVLPKGHSVEIQAAGEVNGAFRASVYVHSQNLDDWSSGIEVEGECDVETVFPLLLTTLRTDGVEAQQFRYRATRIADCDCEDYGALDACLVGDWDMESDSRGKMFGEDGTVGGRVGITFYSSGVFVQQFSNLTFQAASYTSSGRLKMLVLKGYQGRIRGCAAVAPQGRRLDGAIPMQTTVLSDGVTRHVTITHGGGVGTTTDKTEHGLEHWFWPHKPTYASCDGDTLTLESRVYRRTGR